MEAGQGLIIRIGADTSDIDKAAVKTGRTLSELEKRVQSFASAFNTNSLSTKGIDRVNDALVVFKSNLAASQRATVAPPTQPLQNFNKTVNASNQTVTDFSRILSDLPYGFQGIQNNLNPLVESFGRLKAQTGSTGGAIKSLLAGLVGGGGFGLALSAITAAISFATIGFGAWTRGMGGSKKALDEVKDSAKETKEEISKIASELAKDVSRANSLVTGLGSGQFNVEERKAALKELKTINSDYFGSLKEENGLIVGLTGAYQGYLASIMQIGRTKAIEAQITRLFDKKLSLELKVDPVFNAAIDPDNQRQLAALQRQLQDLGGPVKVDKNFNPFLEAGNKLLQQRITLQNQIAILQKGANRIILAPGVAGEISDIESRIKALSATLAKEGNIEIKVPEIKLPKGAKEAKVEIDKVKEAFAKLMAELKEMQINPDFSLVPQIKVPTSYVEDYKKGLQQEFERNLGEPIMVPIDVQITAKAVTDIGADFSNKFSAAGLKMPTVPIKFTTDPEGLQQFLAQSLKVTEEVNAIFKNAFTDIGAGIGESIGNALSGENFSSGIEGIMVIIGDAIAQMGKAMIAYGATTDSIKKLLSTGIFAAPGAAIAAGVLAIATGTLIKNSFKPKAFAEGGVLSGPVNALMGEYPGAYNNPEVIAPLSKLKDMIGGMGAGQINLTGELVARGRDLVFVLNREQRMQGRNY